MIPVVYFRSSSLNCWHGCEQLYFLTYVLGLDEPTGHKAEMGTIVHKTMEILAKIKLALQQSPNQQIVDIDDEHVGKISIDTKDFLKPHYLSSEEIEKINKGMKSKSVYKTKKIYKEGDVRYGVECVEKIFLKCFNFYKERSKHDWKPSNKRDCMNWVWGFLDYDENGSCDPRRQKIVAAEPFFDIEIKKDWAKVDDGYLSIKGTVDLITEIEHDGVKILNVIDYKTGSRVDWNKSGMPPKTYSKLQDDTQLMLYYYATKALYPDYDCAIINIVFVRDGGLFSICFDDEHLQVLEDRLKKTLKDAKRCKVPDLFDPNHRDFRCKNICHFGKTKYKNSDNNICKHIHKEIKSKGIEKVIDEYTEKGHSVGHYQNPGE